jgi:hypothetical protein
MNWRDIDLHPTARKVRQFAALWMVFFAAFAVRALMTHKAGAPAFAVVAAVGLVGMLAPAAMRPIFVAASVATFPIGWVVSRALLAIVYYLVFTPFAFAFRIFGRDALQLRRGPSDSYWSPKAPASEPSQYFREF